MHDFGLYLKHQNIWNVPHERTFDVKELQNPLITACTFEKHVVLSFTTITTFPWGFATYVSLLAWWVCAQGERYQACTDILIDSSAC